MGQLIYVIHSFPIADEILNRKGAIYSDRPVQAMACELCGWNRPITLMRSGEQMRSSRAILHNAIGTHATVHEHHGTLVQEMRKGTLSIMQHPDDLAECIKQ
jgi:hypothetical protein